MSIEKNTRGEEDERKEKEYVYRTPKWGQDPSIRNLLQSLKDGGSSATNVKENEVKRERKVEGSAIGYINMMRREVARQNRLRQGVIEARRPKKETSKEMTIEVERIYNETIRVNGDKNANTLKKLVEEAKKASVPVKTIEETIEKAILVIKEKSRMRREGIYGSADNKIEYRKNAEYTKKRESN